MPVFPLTRTIRFLALAGAGFIALGSLNASTVLYYQFDGDVGLSASAIEDSSGNGREGTAAGFSGGTAPIYSSETVGPVIIAGIGGAVVNASNTSSLKFDNPGVNASTPNYVTSAGGRVTLASSAALEPASFTIEAFVKPQDLIQFAGIIGKERPGGSTWLLDSSPVGATGNGEPTGMNIRARYDHQLTTLPANATSPGFNQNFSANQSGANPSISGMGLGNGWNHIAMTYDDSDNRVSLYVNYVLVGTGVLSDSDPEVDELVYTGGLFFIGGGGGGRGFDGWIDEVRFSDTVLTSNQFLRVVPEPSKALLMGLGAVFLICRRKRKA